MRFGCCLNMVSTGSDGTGIENIDKLKEAGFDYVELPLAELTRLGDEERDAVVRRLKSSGMSCEACNNMFPKTFRLTGPDVRIDEVLAYAEKALHIAGSIGAKSVVFGSGPAKMVPEGFPIDEGYRQVVDLLKLVDPIAGKNGITIAIEPLRKAECNLINTFEEGVRLAEDVGGENIRVLVDYYHLTVENESPEKVRKYGKGSLVHVHMANPDGRVFPKEMDESDYRPFFNALREIGYEGRVSCEAYSENFSEDAPSTLRFFRNNMTGGMNMYNEKLVADLEDKARKLRRNVIVSMGVGFAGHIGGSFSSADMVAALYFHKLRHDPENKKMAERDRFLLSKGHVAILQYSALAEAGYFPVEDLVNTKRIDSYLQGHPDVLKTPGIEAGTGSLGQGLSIGLGMAMGLKMDGLDSKVYVLMGDGEQQEGQIWEAAMAATVYNTDNLVGIVDCNKLQATGPICERFDAGDIRHKWESFGWNTIEINGHDMKEILWALDETDKRNGKPTVIIMNTVKGKGLSFAENVVSYHNGMLSKENYDKAMAELS